MALRTERIEARVNPDSAERIRYASELEQMSVSAFMVAAASDRAEQVIADHAVTLVPSDYFDRLLKSLDASAEPMDKLAQVAAAQRARPRFHRR